MPAPCPYEYLDQLAKLAEAYARLESNADIARRRGTLDINRRDTIKKERAKLLKMALEAPRLPQQPLQAEIFR